MKTKNEWVYLRMYFFSSIGRDDTSEEKEDDSQEKELVWRNMWRESSMERMTFRIETIEPCSESSGKGFHMIGIIGYYHLTSWKVFISTFSICRISERNFSSRWWTNTIERDIPIFWYFWQSYFWSVSAISIDWDREFSFPIKIFREYECRGEITSTIFCLSNDTFYILLKMTPKSLNWSIEGWIFRVENNSYGSISIKGRE